MSIEEIYKLRNLTGCGMMDCKKALDLFNNNFNQATQFLKMYGQAVCRRKSNGEQWNKQDYVDYIKNTIEG